MGRPSTQSILDNLLAELGVNDPCNVDIDGTDPCVPSPHRIGDACAVALAALGVEMASVWKQRSGQDESIGVSVAGAIPQLMAIYFGSLHDIPLSRFLPEPSMFAWSDFYRARDGRYVFLLSTYPHLRNINCTVLNCPFDKQRLRQEVAKWDAFELEEKICDLGGTCIAARTREEWHAHPQGQLLLDTPVIDIEKLGDSPPEPWPALGDSSLPLSGIRVLDNTHVIAGPVASRMLAEHGADVLTMSTASHQDPLAMTLETALGKRTAFCDLNEPSHKAQFYKVLSKADVYVTNYSCHAPHLEGRARLQPPRRPNFQQRRVEPRKWLHLASRT